MQRRTQRTWVCHCYECQKRTGSVWCSGSVPIEQVTLSEVTSFSRISDTGSEVTYQFWFQVAPPCFCSPLPPIFIVLPGLLKEQDFLILSFSAHRRT